MSPSERRPSLLSGDLRARVLAEVARTPAPTRRAHQTRTAIIAGGGAVLTTALFFGMGGFKGGVRPLPLVAFTAGFGLVAALVLTGVSARVSRSMLGRPRSTLVLAAASAAPLLAVVALASAVFWPEHATEDLLPKTHVACAVMTIVQGLLPLGALLLPRRGSDPVHPAITGAALGMTAGAWTSMMAYLRCPHPAALHCVVAHVLPTLVLMVLGALLGRALLRVR